MRWLSFYRSSPDVSSGPTYTQASFGYVVQTQDGAEGVVDVGMRCEYATLREAIAAQALERLVVQCGDQADVALDGLHFAPTITDPKKIPKYIKTYHQSSKPFNVIIKTHQNGSKDIKTANCLMLVW